MRIYFSVLDTNHDFSDFAFDVLNKSYNVFNNCLDVLDMYLDVFSLTLNINFDMLDLCSQNVMLIGATRNQNNQKSHYKTFGL